MYCTFDVLYIYLRLLFGIACLAYHTAIKFALYQLLYPEFIVNSFDIKRAAATFVQFVAHSMANINTLITAHSDRPTDTKQILLMAYIYPKLFSTHMHY